MSGNVTAGEINLNGQIALVTGGGRGLGRAFAQALAAAGAAVAVTARSEDELTETVRLIQGGQGHARAFPADVSDPHAIEMLTIAVEKQLGSVDVLVNNAGVMAPFGPDWEVDIEAWWRTFEINVHSAFLCARAVLPSMIARRHGRIINITSSAASNKHAYASAYGPSKAALSQWTSCLAEAANEYGVHVFAYAPGFVRTAMTEFLAGSPTVHKWYGTRFRVLFDQGVDTPLARAVHMFMFLVSGKADALSGRHIDVEDVEAELLQRIDEILEDDLYTLRRRTQPDTKVTLPDTH